jgi:hypothetical protein
MPIYRRPFAEKCLSKRVFLLFAIMTIFFLSTGCGRKASPRPPRILPPPVIVELDAQINQESVNLVWSISGFGQQETVTLLGFIIYKAKTPTTEADCVGCPVVFQKVNSVLVSEKNDLSDQEKTEWSYHENIEAGYRYVYKVVPYGEGGYEIGDSKTVKFMR